MQCGLNFTNIKINYLLAEIISMKARHYVYRLSRISFHQWGRKHYQAAKDLFIEMAAGRHVAAAHLSWGIIIADIKLAISISAI